MLSPKAQSIIKNYLSLPFPGLSGVRCPYFINKRKVKRGALRPLIGKGTPKEIVEESKIISIQYHYGIFDHDGCCFLHEGEEIDPKKKIEKIRNFLIDNGLGIDCSGLATHILRAHFLETKNVDIVKGFIKNIPGNFLRKIIRRLRPVENIGVKSVYANDLNTEKLGDENTVYNFSTIKAGDVIIMLGVDKKQIRNHILVITNTTENMLEYVHSRTWSIEGQYGHGVNTGKIKIVNPDKGLLSQVWEEFSPAVDPNLFNNQNANQTFLEAKDAVSLEIRRIKI